jgi:hypothetical protein
MVHPKALETALALVLLVGCAQLSGSPTTAEPRTAAPATATPLPTATDARAAECGAGALAPVLGTFAVAHAKEVLVHIPMMGIAPELDGSDAPAYVVLFDGPVPLPYTGGPPAPSGPPTGVVCVVIGDDRPIYFVNVDVTGWHG